ncbi:hypothetical protein [Mycoplasma zalophi]|uniref:hypothetical protein n=1 Tax=Mycoplasma zalophi TaxID=191287 RepID=UPI001C0FCDFC|nr:hypothetical protein [Mycoplasma zalophi]MBU4691164.1 hypothetical protein [Mycoplasma zalophi]
MEKENKKKNKKQLLWILWLFLLLFSITSISAISTYFLTKNSNKNSVIKQKINKNYYDSQLKSLEDDLLDKAAKILELKNKLKNNSEDDSENQKLTNELKTLESEYETLKQRILELNSIIENKNQEISELTKNIKDYEEKYIKKEDIDNEDFKNENFDIVLLTTYEKSQSIDPLDPVDVKNYSSKVTLKKGITSNKLTEKEFLFEFNKEYVEEVMKNRKLGVSNEVKYGNIKWNKLIFQALINAGVTFIEDSRLEITNKRIFYFGLDDEDLIDVIYLDKNLNTQTMTAKNEDDAWNKLVNLDDIHKTGNHYRIIIKLKWAPNRIERSRVLIPTNSGEEMEFTYYKNKDVNLKNYEVDKKYQDNPDIKFYWKEYKDRDDENNIPAHIDLIIYLSAKKQKELFGSWDAKLSDKRDKINQILQEEIEQKEWYIKSLEEHKLKVTSWFINDMNNYNLEYSDIQSYDYNNKIPLFINVLRINFLGNEDTNKN